MPQEVKHTTTTDPKTIAAAVAANWDFEGDWPKEAVLSAITYAIVNPAVFDFYRREIIADGYLIDPDRARVFDLVADVLPEPDIIDGFDFSGMDWGDEPEAA